MRKGTLVLTSSLYRDDYRIGTWRFGQGRKALAVVGSMRGNEVQQLYTASLLMGQLKRLEEEDLIAKDIEILVIPSLNPYSMNISRRFYPIDNTDINRMFPGYDQGETTQRIAGKIFELVKDYEYGIQLASNYLAGDFMSHINIMDTGMDYLEDAAAFGCRYIIKRSPTPYDTTTLNYNWQIWNVKAFSLYTTTTERIDRESAMRGVDSILAFLYARGLISERHMGLFSPQVVSSSGIVTVRSNASGFFFPSVKVEDFVHRGQSLGIITDPEDNSIREEIKSPGDAVVYFLNSSPMCYAQTALLKLIPY